MWDETWLLQKHFPHSLHLWFLSCMDSLMFHELTVIGFLTLTTFITVFLVRIFWYVETHSHYIRKVLPLCGFIDECLGMTSEKKLLHTDYIHKAFPLCILWWMLRDDFWEKNFSTLATFIRFFPCVDSLMSNERWLLRKSFSTLATFIRLFPCVDSLVND